MAIIVLLIGFVAFFYMLWSLGGALFKSGSRGKKRAQAGASFVVLIASLIGLVLVHDYQARQDGFEDGLDQTAAKEAGISDPVVWKNQRAEIEAEAEKKRTEQARVAKLEAETKSREAQDALRAKDAAEAEAVLVAEVTAAEEAEKCRADIKCWGEDAWPAASAYCPSEIVSLAKWDHEWTDGWTETKFERYRWKDQKNGVVTYLGNKLKLQNGFGAWKHVSYSCDFDPSTKTVVDAQIYAD